MATSNKHSPFDFVKSINEKTEISDIEGYVPFIINRALSYHRDCIVAVNDMNMYPKLDHELQYAYLSNSIRKKKRYHKWTKREKDETILLLMEYYQVNSSVAKQYRDLMSEQDIEKIRIKTMKGGKE